MNRIKVGDIIRKQWVRDQKEIYWHAIVLNVKRKTFSFVIYFSNYYKGRVKHFEWTRHSLSDIRILNKGKSK